MDAFVYHIAIYTLGIISVRQGRYMYRQNCQDLFSGNKYIELSLGNFFPFFLRRIFIIKIKLYNEPIG